MHPMMAAARRGNTWLQETLRALSRCCTRLEDMLRHQATHDSPTGLANRTLLCEALEQALHSAERRNHLVAVLFIDTDRFQAYQRHTKSRSAGDEILCAARKRLSGCMRETDLMVRYGGDEFVVVLSEIRHLADVLSILQKIEQVFIDPFVFGGQELVLTCCIGIAIYPRDGQDAETLLKRADSTTYRVKELTRTGQLSALRARAKGQEQEVLFQ